VGCPWCDTKNTWALTKEAPISDVLAKQGSDDRFAWVEIEDLANLVIGCETRHVVITGGEPCQYDLGALTRALVSRNHTVQIETSGTEPVRATAQAFVTMSPKFDMPGGRTVVDDAIERADEFKMPVGKPADVEKLVEMLKRRRRPWRPDMIWLQPISESEKATETCRRLAAERGWRVSLQMHKQAQIR
jgi:7-carboxy-7-deazaguanine synthase